MLLATVVIGCGGDDDADAGAPKCLDPLPKCTTPTFPPSYDAIYDNVLKTTCASSSTGGSCHYGPTADKARAGLALSDRDKAYDFLLGKVDGRARVIPGDPECSILVQRLESSDPNFRMPSGNTPLPEGVRCVVRQWIESGAERK